LTKCDAALNPVELDGGTYRGLRRRGHRGPFGTARTESVQDAANLRRGPQGPGRKHASIPACGRIRGAQERGGTIDHEKRQKTGNSEVFGRFPTLTLHLRGVRSETNADHVPLQATAGKLSLCK